MCNVSLVTRFGPLVLAFVPLLFATAVVQADVFVLKSGGWVEGDLLTSDEVSLPGFYLVKTTAGGRIKLAKSQVEQVVHKSAAEVQYDSLLTKMPDTTDGHWTMAQWCLKEGLRQQRAFHLEQVVKHDPSHVEARHGLGYSRVDDRWILVDEWMTGQGYVRHGSSWRLPQEVVLQRIADDIELAEKNWRKKVKTWRGWINRRSHQQAMDNFRSINDPLAAMGIAELFEKEQMRLMKLLYIEILGRLDTAKAKTPLIQAALEDDSQRIRDACLDELEKQGSHQAVPYFLEMLDVRKNPSNTKINRAGIALGRLNDPVSIKPLIDALITEHKQAPPSSSGGMGIGASFGRAGSPAGLSVGGGGKLLERKLRNEGVLYGLKALTNEDFRFDQDDWNAWYVEANTPKNVRLRRDG